MNNQQKLYAHMLQAPQEWYTKEELSDAIKIPNDAVAGALRRLRDHGYIKLHLAGTASRWQVIDPTVRGLIDYRKFNGLPRDKRKKVLDEHARASKIGPVSGCGDRAPCENVKPAEAGFFRIRTPKCFNSPEDYMNWRAAARHTDPGLNQYCADCTPEYQSAMIQQYRCQYPGTTFVLDADGMVTGLRSVKDKRAA